jgi:erythromycin esterase-like protein
MTAATARKYRSMFRGGTQSWNLRDQHMAEALETLVAHLERTSGPTRVAVWEHNSHLGDNRATELGYGGQLNVGQSETERISHYFHARLGNQFDAVIHVDETHAVEPLERTSEWEAGDLPETYPWGI